MEVSLEQAIEIHARALRAHRGSLAPKFARRKAQLLANAGDAEGSDVWTRVAEIAETLPDPQFLEDEVA